MATITTTLLKKYPKLDVLMVCLIAEVAKNEGHCISSYSERLKQDENSILYCARRLSKSYREREGFDLVKIKNCPKDRRRRLLYLTAKGKTVAQLTAPLFEIEESVKRCENTTDMFEK